MHSPPPHILYTTYSIRASIYNKWHLRLYKHAALNKSRKQTFYVVLWSIFLCRFTDEYLNLIDTKRHVCWSGRSTDTLQIQSAHHHFVAVSRNQAKCLQCFKSKCKVILDETCTLSNKAGFFFSIKTTNEKRQRLIGLSVGGLSKVKSDIVFSVLVSFF